MKGLQDILKDPRIWNYKQILYMHTGMIKLPDCGMCSVAWECADGYEHVSVSPKKKFNIPSWNDMCVLKDVFFKGDEEAYQIHPKKTDYVNFVENCLHLWKPIGHEIDELISRECKPTIMPEKVTERLTKRNKYGGAYFPEYFKEPCNGLQCAKDDCEFIGKVCYKLAECEDKEEPQKVIKICPVIPEEKYECPECGSPLTDSDVFAGYCKWCGQKITMEGK